MKRHVLHAGSIFMDEKHLASWLQSHADAPSLYKVPNLFSPEHDDFLVRPIRLPPLYLLQEMQGNAGTPISDAASKRFEQSCCLNTRSLP